MKPKKELIRILRTEEEFLVDVTGKKNGRGAHLLSVVKHAFDLSVKSHGLERSFKQEIPQEVMKNLKRRWSDWPEIKYFR